MKLPEQNLQDTWVSYQRTKCINLFTRTRMILDFLIANITPDEQFSTEIGLNRVELIYNVIELYQKLHSIVIGENQKARSMVAGIDDLCAMFAKDLELQRLMKDTTDMVNIVKKVIRKHINIKEILTKKASGLDTLYTSDLDSYDSDGHKHKKMKF